MSAMRAATTFSPAFTFVLTMGLVNLFGDVTYEGGGSINGPFLGTLGASAATVSIIAGVGEFLGYAIRLPAGYISDKTGKVWLLTFIGYSINWTDANVSDKSKYGTFNRLGDRSDGQPIPDY